MFSRRKIIYCIMSLGAAGPVKAVASENGVIRAAIDAYKSSSGGDKFKWIWEKSGDVHEAVSNVTDVVRYGDDAVSLWKNRSDSAKVYEPGYLTKNAAVLPKAISVFVPDDRLGNKELLERAAKVAGMTGEQVNLTNRNAKAFLDTNKTLSQNLLDLSESGQKGEVEYQQLLHAANTQVTESMQTRKLYNSEGDSYGERAVFAVFRGIDKMFGLKERMKAREARAKEKAEMEAMLASKEKPVCTTMDFYNSKCTPTGEEDTPTPEAPVDTNLYSWRFVRDDGQSPAQANCFMRMDLQHWKEQLPPTLYGGIGECQRNVKTLQERDGFSFSEKCVFAGGDMASTYVVRKISDRELSVLQNDYANTAGNIIKATTKGKILRCDG